MVTLKLKLVKGKTSDEASDHEDRNALDWGVNRGT